MIDSRFTVRAAFLIAVAIAITIIPNYAMAYVGPGAGLTVIGTVVALFGAVLLGVVGFLWYPLKRLIGRNKQPTGSAAPESSPKVGPGAAKETASRE